MTLTKAELADLVFEKVGLHKREAKAIANPSPLSHQRSLRIEPHSNQRRDHHRKGDGELNDALSPSHCH